MTDNAQHLIFGRYYDGSKKEFMQDMLGVTTVKKRTQGEDVYAFLISMMKSRNIETKSVMSLTRDGALAILSRGKRLVGRLVKDNSDLIKHHCIIHQAMLCASLGDKYRDVMETI